MSVPVTGAGHPDWQLGSQQGATYQVLAPQTDLLAGGGFSVHVLPAATLFDLLIIYAQLPALVELAVFQADPLGNTVAVVDTMATVSTEEVRAAVRSAGGDVTINLFNHSAGPLTGKVVVYGVVGGLPSTEPPYQAPVSAFSGALAAGATIQLAVPGSGLLDRVGWAAWCGGNTFVVQAVHHLPQGASFTTIPVTQLTSATGNPADGELALAGLGTAITMNNTGAGAAVARLVAHGYRTG